MADGYLLSGESLKALAALLKKQADLLNSSSKSSYDTWPNCSPARVVTAITAREGINLGVGEVALLTSRQKADTPEEFELDKPGDDNARIIQVFNLEESSEVPVDKEGFVVQDRWGSHWWVSGRSGGSRRFRAILGEDMTPGDGFAFVTSFSQIEGELPDEPVDVANVMKWYGKEGNVVKVEWNPNFNNGEGEPMGGWEFYAIEVNYTEECFGR